MRVRVVIHDVYEFDDEKHTLEELKRNGGVDGGKEMISKHELSTELEAKMYLANYCIQHLANKLLMRTMGA